MKRLIWDTLKVFIIFTLCTFLFYYGLQLLHSEYEQIHRFDPPNGPAIKVNQSQSRLFDRIPIIFQRGE
ncbi:DUF4227 family protein [Oceanobacillus sp. CF4.6]|uniref:DUF4227 family protein n=1 Tax=Oceanobacillus sp. CF4.6 TaxID=3373080 RepID=UPI003EE45FDC